MTGRARGIDRDRKVRDLLAGEDWFAVCSRGSHGAADIVAIRVGSTPRVIQVKSTAAGPYHSFSPADRRELSYAAELGGADALLAWWPPRGRLRWIPEEEWPR
jgi:Holliday junction resolvase hjc